MLVFFVGGTGLLYMAREGVKRVLPNVINVYITAQKINACSQSETEWIYRQIRRKHLMPFVASDCSSSVANDKSEVLNT